MNPVNLFKLCANFGRTAVSLLRKILGRCPYYVVKIVPAIGRLVRSRIEQIFDALPDFWIFDVSCRGSFKLLQNLRLCFVLGITLRRRRLQTMALAFQTSEFIENCQHDPPSGDQGRQLGGILTSKFPMQSPSGGDKGDNRCQCKCGCTDLRTLRGHARCTACNTCICHKCRGEGWSEPSCHLCSWGTPDYKPLSEESLQAMRSSRRSRATESYLCHHRDPARRQDGQVSQVRQQRTSPHRRLIFRQMCLQLHQHYRMNKTIHYAVGVGNTLLDSNARAVHNHFVERA